MLILPTLGAERFTGVGLLLRKARAVSELMGMAEVMLVPTDWPRFRLIDLFHADGD